MAGHHYPELSNIHSTQHIKLDNTVGGPSESTTFLGCSSIRDNIQIRVSRKLRPRPVLPSAKCSCCLLLASDCCLKITNVTKMGVEENGG